MAPYVLTPPGDPVVGNTAYICKGALDNKVPIDFSIPVNAAREQKECAPLGGVLAVVGYNGQQPIPKCVDNTGKIITTTSPIGLPIAPTIKDVKTPVQAAIPAGGCGIGKDQSLDFDRCIWYPLVALIGSTLISASAWLLALAGMLFNWLVDNTIILYRDSMFKLVEPGINVGWAAFRDIANIAIIGMFVYMAIMTILGNKDYGYKRLLATILIIAVLINFSLLFTKMIIDASNFTASQLYALTHQQESLAETQAEAARRSSGAVQVKTGSNVTDFATVGVAAEFVKYLGVMGAVDTYDTLKSAAAGGNGWKVLVHGVFAAILLGGAAFMFLYGSFILLYRAVFFIILMLTSSIAFATHLHPRLSEGKYGPYGWDAWWKCLLGNAILAPLLMIFLYVTLFIAASVNSGLGGKGTLGSLVAGRIDEPFGLGALFNYLIIGGLLFASFKIAGGIATSSCENCWTNFMKPFNGAASYTWDKTKDLFKRRPKQPTPPQPTAEAGAGTLPGVARARAGAGAPRPGAPAGAPTLAERRARALQTPRTATRGTGVGAPPATPVAALLRPPVRAAPPPRGAPAAMLRPRPVTPAPGVPAAAAPAPAGAAAGRGVAAATGGAGAAGAAQFAQVTARVEQAIDRLTGALGTHRRALDRHAESVTIANQAATPGGGKNREDSEKIIEQLKRIRHHLERQGGSVKRAVRGTGLF